MESMEHIIIVGAGIAGLTTALGFHRLGIRSVVLESSDNLRTTGFAFTTWANAWKALDAVGIGDHLREQHQELLGLIFLYLELIKFHDNYILLAVGTDRTEMGCCGCSVLAFSAVTGLQTAESMFDTTGTQRHEVRCVRRNTLLETLEKELPQGTIRYSSKVVSVEESGYHKLVLLADGTVLKAKVLIGCDGVNSAVAKWLGFKKPAFVGRSAIRGFVDYENGHGFESKFLQYFGNGIRFGFIPCDDKTMYWFFTWSLTSKDKEMEENPVKMKQFVLDRLGKVPDRVREIVERNNLDSITSSPLRFRHPWEVLWGNISKGNVCVTGDAFHPMTPDIGQGGCAALEDGVVLARCLGEALQSNPGLETVGSSRGGEEYKKIEMALKKYANERRWRGFELISTAYMVGYIQQSNGRVLKFLRDKIFATLLVGQLLRKASYDCGKLSSY